MTIYPFCQSSNYREISEKRRRLTEEKILELARRCLVITEEYDSVGYEEFVGIARGANLSPGKLFVTQGLTDLRDVMTFSDDVDAEGCSSFIVSAPITAKNQLLLGKARIFCHTNEPEGGATNACVIVILQTGELHACRGQAHFGKWQDVSC